MHIPILSITAAMLMAGLTIADREHVGTPGQQETFAAAPSPEARSGKMDNTRDPWDDSALQLGGLGGPGTESNQTPVIESQEILDRLPENPCGGVDGIWMGNVSSTEDLSALPVPSGACCTGIHGQCTITSLVDCEGTYLGDGTSCSMENPEENDWFGYSVAVSGDGLTALVGTPLRDEVIYECDPGDVDCEENVEFNCGSVTVYRRSVVTNPWSAFEVLLPEPTDYEEENRISLAQIEFGHSVAISDDGTLAIIGAPYYSNYYDELNDVEVENAFNCGTAYVFQRFGTGARFGNAIHQFLPFNDDEDPADSDDDYNDTAFDWFGWSVSIYKYPDPPPRVCNPRAIVGSPNDLSVLEDNIKPGSIYIYDSNSQNGGGLNAWPDNPDDPRWVKFVQEDGYEFTSDLFGISVSIDRNYAIAGAPQHAKAGIGLDAGAAFVYRQRGCLIWELDEELIPDEPLPVDWDDLETGDVFGWSVSISVTPRDPLGTTPETRRALVGSPHDEYGACCFGNTCLDNYDLGDCIDDGGTYLGGFSECSEGSSGGTCRNIAIEGILAVRGPCCFGLECENFTYAIDCVDAGGTFMPGYETCAEADELCGYIGLDRGSAWIFRRTGFGWIVEQKIFPDDGVTDDWFGYSVSLNENAALVGANRAIEWAWDDWYNELRNIEVGNAYYFHREVPALTWERVNRLLSEFPEWGEEFGRAVSISEAYDTVGLPSDDQYEAFIGAPYHMSLWNQDDSVIEEIYNTGAAFVFDLDIPVEFIIDP